MEGILDHSDRRSESGIGIGADGAADDPVYRRAQTMVNDGNAAGGRALVDSMIAGRSTRLE